MRWSTGVSIWFLGMVLWAGPLAAKTHVMSRGADPWAVPAWEDVFDEGPFDLPAGTTRDTPPDEALRLGWRALHALDDREAERAFRLVITQDEESAMAYLGLALANESLPGRALAFANRAVAKSTRASETDRRLIHAFAAIAPKRDALRRRGEADWAREVRAAWSSAAPPVKYDMAALLVRGLIRAGFTGEARLRLRELLTDFPDHPARAYALLLAIRPADAITALKDLPASPGAYRAAGAMLERLGRPVEAAGWYAAAAALAGTRHPADMEDWRLVEEMKTAEVAALAAAGRAEFPDVVPVSVRVDAWLRLQAWDRLGAQPDIPAKAPIRDRFALAHARALAAFVQGRPADAYAWLSEVQQLLAKVRSGAAGVPPTEVPVFEDMESELQMYNLLGRGAADEARGRFASLRHIPPARAARLALALELPLEALRYARAAVKATPHGQPERELLATVAQATQQPLSEEEANRDQTPWQPIPAPPAGTPTAPVAPAGQLPEWTLTDADGTPRSLSEVQGGQPTVFLFFLGHECRHCMDQLRTFDPMAARFTKAGARLVAVSIDDPTGVAKTFASLESEPVRRPFTFPVLADHERRAFTAWGVIDEFYDDAIHGVFVVDAAGRLRWRHLGVEPYMMVADVLAAVEELGAVP
ncbi:MAG: redoxin domain-containing protein [Verrucomicrobiales bacterium]